MPETRPTTRTTRVARDSTGHGKHRPWTLPLRGWGIKVPKPSTPTPQKMRWWDVAFSSFLLNYFFPLRTTRHLLHDSGNR